MSNSNGYYSLTRLESKSIRDQLRLHKIKHRDLAEYIGTSNASLSRRLSMTQGFPLDQLQKVYAFIQFRNPLFELDQISLEFEDNVQRNDFEEKLIDLYKSYYNPPNIFEKLSEREIDEVKDYIRAIYERYK